MEPPGRASLRFCLWLWCTTVSLQGNQVFKKNISGLRPTAIYKSEDRVISGKRSSILSSDNASFSCLVTLSLRWPVWKSPFWLPSMHMREAHALSLHPSPWSPSTRDLQSLREAKNHLCISASFLILGPGYFWIKSCFWNHVCLFYPVFFGVTRERDFTSGWYCWN